MNGPNHLGLWFIARLALQEEVTVAALKQLIAAKMRDEAGIPEADGLKLRVSHGLQLQSLWTIPAAAVS